MNFVTGFIAGFIVTAVIALIWRYGRYRDRSYKEVREHLEAFLAGTAGPYDWDDFVSVRIKDPYLDAIKDRCNRLHGDYPPEIEGHWCSPEGEEFMRGFIRELKQHEDRTKELQSPKNHLE